MGNCGECANWGSMQHDEKSGDYVAPCLAMPPVFVFGLGRGCWPVTSIYDRCGHWKVVSTPAPKAAPPGGWPADHTAAPNCMCTECIPF